MQTVELAAAVLTDRKPNKDKYRETDWEYLYKFSCFHGVSGLIAYALDDFDDIPANVLHAFENDKNWVVYRDARQAAVVRELLSSFESSGLSVMPLKGYWIKKLYPLPEFRSMGDIDVLIRQPEYPQADKLLKSIGYDYSLESAHEYVYIHHTGIKLEVHKSIVPPYNSDLYNYYGDGWKFAVSDEKYKHLYKMTDRDFYVYTAAHAAKHYLNAGFGIRQVADLFIMKSKIDLDETDRKYIDIQLEKLGLTVFYRKLMMLAEKWFEGKNPCEDTYDMEEYILSSGVYGTEEHRQVSELYRTSANRGYSAAKLNKVFRLFFPKPENMQNKYPRLKKQKYLYPWYVLKRLAEALFTKEEKFDVFSGVFVEDSKTEKYAKHWESLGIKKTL